MIRGDRPDVCIFHGPTCFDGFAAAWAIWQQWPQTEFIPAQYGDEAPFERLANKGVLIVDFSFPREVMERIARVARWVVVLDHHKTAEAALTPLLEDGTVKGVFDMTRSGARLAWQYAWGVGNPPRLIQHVEDRDLWKFEINGTQAVLAALGSIPLEFDDWTAFGKRLEDFSGRDAIIAEGAAIMRTRQKEIRQILDASARLTLVADVEVFVANVPYHLASEAGHLLAKGRPFSATYFDRADGMRQWSLRSEPEGVDVSEVAKLFGGGGHKNAAGFTLPTDEWPLFAPGGDPGEGEAIQLNAGRGKVEVVGSEPAP